MFNSFEYLAPRSWEEACGFLREHAKDAVAMAGGTDLLVRMRERILQPKYIVDIKALPGFIGISATPGGGLSIGAATPLNQIARSAEVQNSFPILAEAAHSVGSYQVRNRASIGGNLCNASPAADTAPALLVLDAAVRLTGPGGSSRQVPLKEFFVGPGKTVLQPGELMATVEIPPLLAGAAGAYLKLARTKAVDLSQVSVAVLALATGEVRIALGAVAPTPVRASQAEDLCRGRRLDNQVIQEVLAATVAAVSPIGDLRASREYRLEMVEVLTRRALGRAMAALGGN